MKASGAPPQAQMGELTALPHTPLLVSGWASPPAAPPTNRPPYSPIPRSATGLIPGQVFKECVDCPHNPATCNGHIFGNICTLECLSGCECPTGQVLDVKNRRCVFLKQCPLPWSVGPCIKVPNHFFHCQYY